MTSFKRILIATLMGVVSGLICVGFASTGGTLSLPLFLNILTGRILIGFVIGISALRIHWAINGPVMGLIVGIPAAFGGMLADVEGFTQMSMFMATLVMGIIYGFLIEFVTSVLFKAKQI
ncbi:MAG: hypothetical protein K0B81_06515 [Candidatus Cloacimonetes bacterium]|nr:hypothetical protein [Candidatus Cloacimonadota bacterium]